MPNTIDPTQKQNFLNVVMAAPLPGGPAEAARLQTIMNYYTDIPVAIYRQLNLFASNNTYLTAAMNCFTPAASLLTAAGIWYNQTSSSPPITDPKIIINSTITEVILTPSSPPGYKGLVILGPSTIGEIAVTPGTLVNEIWIGPGAVVDKLTGSLTTSSPPLNARIELVTLAYLKSTPSRLNMATYLSNIGQVNVQGGSYYGGILAYDPQNACTEVVTNLTITDITYNSALLSWTLPVASPPNISYLFINVYWRLTGSMTWIAATTSDGDYIGNTGFIFRDLNKSTLYDFKIETVCSTGGLASVSISGQTVCCGVASPP